MEGWIGGAVAVAVRSSEGVVRLGGRIRGVESVRYVMCDVRCVMCDV